jgi:hypothetical protein
MMGKGGSSCILIQESGSSRPGIISTALEPVLELRPTLAYTAQLQVVFPSHSVAYISCADTAPAAVEPCISAAISVASYCLRFRCPLNEDLLIEDWNSMVSDSVKTKILSFCKRLTGRDSM